MQQQKQTHNTTVPDNEYYSETSRASHNDQQSVADAWGEGDWPTDVSADAARAIGLSDGETAHYIGSPNQQSSSAGSLHGSRLHSRSGRGGDGGINFYGVQRPDGSGTLWHYRTREAIRTSDGLIISNRQCWSGGFAHCSTPAEIDGSVPFSAFEEVTPDDIDVFDIVEVRSSMALYPTDEGPLAAVYWGRDSTANHNDGHTGHFAMALSPEEVPPTDTNTDEWVNSLLTPETVADSHLSVESGDEYAKTKLSDAEADAHAANGGSVTIKEKWGREQAYNYQQYRADLQGNTIVRQGEWFFIPVKSHELPFESDRPYFKPNTGEWATSGSGLPTECDCETCDSTRFDWDNEIVCAECGETHTTEDSNPPGWLDTFGSHTTRDVKVSDGTPYVRGTVSHTDNEHNQINLGETWHKAVCHDREVFGYDPNPGNGSAGGGYD